jgi:hypothetical protein
MSTAERMVHVTGKKTQNATIIRRRSGKRRVFVWCTVLDVIHTHHVDRRGVSSAALVAISKERWRPIQPYGE